MTEKSNVKIKKDLKEEYELRVQDELEKLDKERILKKRIAVICSIIAAVVAIAAVLIVFDNENAFEFIKCIIAFPIIAASVVIRDFSKFFENEFKSRALNIMMKAHGLNFSWTKSRLIKTKDIKLSQLFSTASFNNTDDNFLGNYKGIRFELTETYIYQSKYQRFYGVLIKFNMNKNFTGHTIVVEKPYEMNFTKSRLAKVILESIDFDKKFETYSTDQIEARYLLTPSFMERLQKMNKVFNGNNVRCSFKDNNVIIAIDTGKDMFKLGSLFSEAKVTSEFTKLHREIKEILAVIDILKLNMNIGM